MVKKEIKKIIDKGTVNIELTVIRSKNELHLRKQLAEGNTPNGEHFKLSDAGSHFLIEHKINENEMVNYSFSKEELFRQLAESVLTKKPKFEIEVIK